MTMVESILHILEGVREKEKEAEQRCEKILQSLEINGFHDDIEKIKNDEIEHQQIVNELIAFL
jgi:hypothetical protein